MDKAQLLQEALELVKGDRNETHGDARAQLGQTAALWAVYLGVSITAEQVAVCNILQKISRSCHGKPNIDNPRDAAGYSGIWGELISGTASDGEVGVAT